MSQPAVSIVIPAFNEEDRLPATLERVRACLSGSGESFEIVVVDDGSTDGTVDRARQAGGDQLVLLSNEGNRGKGFSVRRGMLEARGQRRLMCDADLSTPIEELARLETAMREGADVVIASRAHPLSRIEVHQPAFRENVGRLFNLLVRVAALPGLHDTQCGFKLFSGRAAQAAFAASRLDGFAFDVEALFVARRQGFRVVEVPTVWRNDSASRVTTWRGLLAFVDVLRVRLNGWRGLYDPSGT